MFPAEDGDDPANPIVPAGVHLAPLWRRVLGLLIDQVLITVPVLVGAVLIGTPAADIVEGNSVAFWVGVVMTSAALLYETVCVWRGGRTLGKLICGTRVVHVADGGSVPFSAALIRALVPAAFSVIPAVGQFLGFAVYLLAFFDQRRQGLHDKAAGTLVGLKAG